MPTSPARLGELLEARGQITREQLLRALRNQKVLGGRLGTCLLEIEAVSEEQLCATLAQQQGVPSASPEDLRGIADDVLALLPAKIATRCRAIAFRASSTQVQVALMDARNLAIQDEISFVIGKRIRWHVALELRVLEALEKCYGEECPTRLAKLLDRMNRSRFLWARESASLAAQGAGTGGKGEQLLWDRGIAGVGGEAGDSPASPDSRESISLELPQFQHQALDLPEPAPRPVPQPGAAPALSPRPVPPPPAPVATAVPAPDPAPVQSGRKKAAPAESGAAPAASPELIAEAHRKLSVDEAEQRLVRPRERDDVARAVIDFASGLARNAILFVVRKDEVAAWVWSGAAIDGPKLAALRLRLQQPSLFADFKHGGRMFRGHLSPLPAHLAIADCLDRQDLGEAVVVLPLRVRDRLVAALYLEPGIAAAADLPPADLDDLERVIAKAEIAFELCIMQAKLRQA